MLINTDRLNIRDVRLSDETAFIEMASDGSLQDIGFDKNCNGWMKEWILEAQDLTEKDNPREDYLAYVIELNDTGTVIGSVGCTFYADMNKVGITYFVGAKQRNNGYASEAIKAYVSYYFKHHKENELIATIREDNIPSWKAIEKVGFVLMETRMYKDINDASEELYRFYSIYKTEKF